MRPRLIALGGLLAGLAAAGCGDDGPRVVKVSGVATYKGEPVPSLLLIFQPAAGRPSNGTTNAKGEFTLSYTEDQSGAVVGTHTVTISYFANTPDEEMGKVKRHPAVKDIVSRYGDATKTTLKVEITEPTSKLELKLD